ncbi:Protein CBG24266 [Caenorhabditis briggsae]|uniref:Uncharacterized protein n=2 Tax=Caenorhabditis briggsae TaxID=6238 RepID=A0AAE9JBY7_CAEBR|nr:Protein CBG24266 [Caenorhabditis briggsae]UMM21960.1 hypothetical protein L5515_003415 [Caenorhabditis briggsae]CAP20918.1 Protein CBG24266 [Caenorhabditis briggsae]
MNIFHIFSILLVILVALITENSASTLRDMFNKNIQKRHETTGGMQTAYSKLLPPHVAEMFLRKHF